MRHSICALLAAVGLASALTQDCTGTASDEGGNWFCGAVDQILYEGIVGQGSYQAVTDMSGSGDCATEAKAYSGPLSPLDEGLSIHVRGPFQLKEAAVYNLAPEKKKRASSAPYPHGHARRHGHRQLHEERRQKRADWVVATIDGQVVSWINNYFGPSSVAPAPAPAPTVTEAAAPAPPPPAPTTTHAAAPSQKPKSGGSNGKASPPSGGSVSGSDWERVAYYNSEQGSVDNMVFLGNYGGQGSGVWDTTWGNSLAYLNADGNGGSSGPQTLKDTTLPSNTEFAIFSADKCDSSCGYSRASDVAYKGFSGANKVFLFRFQMPVDGNRGFNGDMPALWLLNAAIPRTMQYGTCSCWATGCGEADIFEVLAPGDTKCKSTFHLANGAGSSDYFARPTDGFVRVAVVFDESAASVSIRQLDDDVDFADGLSAEAVKGWEAAGGDGESSSVFQLSS